MIRKVWHAMGFALVTFAALNTLLAVFILTTYWDGALEFLVGK